MHSLNYQTYRLSLTFDSPVVFNTLPAFIFRGILGKELRRLCCVLKRSGCGGCPLGQACVYNRLFESPVPAGSNVLPGRDKAAHPFILYSDARPGAPLPRMELELVLLGGYDQFFPYIYLGLENAGKTGATSRRFTYAISAASCQGKSIQDREGVMIINEIPHTWIYGLARYGKEATAAVVTFQTPFRVKRNGRIVSMLESGDVFGALYRRMRALCGFYGKTAQTPGGGPREHEVVHRALEWTEYERYSYRQEANMKLGGVTGRMVLKGPFDDFELSLLAAGALFSGGKNASFGLGRMEVSYM